MRAIRAPSGLQRAVRSEDFGLHERTEDFNNFLRPGIGPDLRIHPALKFSKVLSKLHYTLVLVSASGASQVKFGDLIQRILAEQALVMGVCTIHVVSHAGDVRLFTDSRAVILWLEQKLAYLAHCAE